MSVSTESTFRVGVANGLGTFVIQRALVQIVDTIALGGDGGRQMNDNHLEERFGSRQPFLHYALEQRFPLQILLLVFQRDFQLCQQLRRLLLLEIHNHIEEFEDWVQDEHAESALKILARLVICFFAPLFGGRVEKRVAPQSANHFLLVDPKFD